MGCGETLLGGLEIRVDHVVIPLGRSGLGSRVLAALLRGGHEGPQFLFQALLGALDAGVVIQAHGNTIRALIKYLEDITDNGIAEVEMPFGLVLLYTVDASGKHVRKETRQIATATSKA